MGFQSKAKNCQTWAFSVLIFSLDLNLIVLDDELKVTPSLLLIAWLWLVDCKPARPHNAFLDDQMLEQRCVSSENVFVSFSSSWRKWQRFVDCTVSNLYEFRGTILYWHFKWVLLLHNPHLVFFDLWELCLKVCSELCYHFLTITHWISWCSIHYSLNFMNLNADTDWFLSDCV